MTVKIYQNGNFHSLSGTKVYVNNAWITLPGTAKIYFNNNWYYLQDIYRNDTSAINSSDSPITS